uniref:K Homology domain-containing protein n=1 Tax=Timema cristinae TaxID=61476 RepID=A0A7R9D0G4_TIMCR|nr:unnamed protein product [Timema cristinae]
MSPWLLNVFMDKFKRDVFEDTVLPHIAFNDKCCLNPQWCSQFQEMQGAPNNSGIPRPPITLRLIVPASQCGSLIGKGGSKIKEIREVTGASIQVASEMLPNSTERAVTISGTSEAITQCIYHICCVMLESPPKGATIPYRPKPQVAGPVILAGGQAYTIQGNYAVPAHADVSTMPMFPGLASIAGHPPLGLPPSPLLHTGLADPLLKNGHLQAALPPAHLAADRNLALFQRYAALAGSQLRTNNQNRNQPGANQQSHEMTVPNELIGCIIGKGGTKIAEISITKQNYELCNLRLDPKRFVFLQVQRHLVTKYGKQISGAMIRISNCEEREGGTTDRTITIQGNPDSVALAQYLINMSGLHHSKCSFLVPLVARHRSRGWALPEWRVYTISWNSDDEDQPMVRVAVGGFGVHSNPNMCSLETNQCVWLALLAEAQFHLFDKGHKF